jgi:sulfotransferase
MIKKTYYFLSGLPRSGSTVLAAILNQNPAVYVTPTSPMLDQLIENQNIWHGLQTVKANPVPDQLTNITREMINAMWAHRPESIIIDKNRGWGKNMPASSILFGKDIPVIATVRDLPSIMASWLTLIKQHPNHISRVIRSRGFEPTDENIMAEMWFNMVQDCMEGLRQLKQDAADRLLLIDYDELITNPLEQLTKIEQFLNLPEWDYDFNNISSDTVDDDAAAWGISNMHSIRSSLAKTSKSAHEVLGDELYYRFVELEKQYQ